MPISFSESPHYFAIPQRYGTCNSNKVESKDNNNDSVGIYP